MAGDKGRKMPCAIVGAFYTTVNARFRATKLNDSTPGSWKVFRRGEIFPFWGTSYDGFACLVSFSNLLRPPQCERDNLLVAVALFLRHYHAWRMKASLLSNISALTSLHGHKKEKGKQPLTSGQQVHEYGSSSQTRRAGDVLESVIEVEDAPVEDNLLPWTMERMAEDENWVDTDELFVRDTCKQHCLCTS